MGVTLDLATYDDIVTSIYDAAVEPGLWQGALARIAEAFSGTTATFLHLGMDPPSSRFIATYNHAAECLDQYARHYVTLDVWNPQIAKLPLGKAATSHELFPPDQLVRTEFYNDFLLDFDVMQGIGGFVERRDGSAILLGVQSGKRRDPYTRADAQLMERIYSHVGRALTVARGFETLQAREAALRDTLDRLPTAIIVVDRYARALILNASARRIVAGRDALFDEPHGLRAGSAAATAQLRQEIAAATHGVSVHAGGVVRLPRATGGRPLVARIVPLGRLARERLALGVPAAAMFIDDPHGQPLPTPDLLRQAFGLSRAEARLVALLAEGQTVGSAADQLQVSRETLRTLLRRAFDKTGTRRQSELLALVARLTAIR